MKTRSLLVTATGFVVVVVSVSGLVFSLWSGSTPAQAQAMVSLASQECTCSRGLSLIEPASGAGPSVLHNCQCGALQCVVHAQSGQLQCR